MKTAPRRVCIFLLLAAASALSAAPVSVADGLGRTVSLPSPAARIVSLSPACTEVLFAVGAADHVVGVTAYCDYPPAAAAKPKVGGFSGKSISIETIVALGPDLVVVEGQMHERVMKLLDSARIPVYAAAAERLEDVYRIIEQLGALSGRGEDGIRAAASLRGRVEAVRARTAGAASRPTGFWIVWDEPLMTAGGATFIGEAMEAAGGRNAFADSTDQYPTVSFESVLSRDPDWLLSGTDHGAKLDTRSLALRQGWRSLRAVKEGRIALIDADSINRAGPRLADAIESLARVFHPEAFE